MYPEKIDCHSGEMHYRGTPDQWEVRDKSGFRQCSYCGCVHPEDLLKLFEQSAYLSGSDWKYGYPHKYYVENVPNPIAGQQVVVSSTSHMKDGQRVNEDTFGPASETITLKFYTKHLNDLLGQPEFEIVARKILEKYDGQYYPRVAFLQNPDGTNMSYVTNAASYDQAIEFMAQQEEKGNA